MSSECSSCLSAHSSRRVVPDEPGFAMNGLRPEMLDVRTVERSRDPLAAINTDMILLVEQRLQDLLLLRILELVPSWRRIAFICFPPRRQNRGRWPLRIALQEAAAVRR